jgi:hypothetical protein
MPRLTNQRYILIHRALRHHWLNNQVLFSYLTPNEQWDLHDFFKSYVDMPDAVLLQHRQEVSAKFPSLAQRAGKALRHLDAVIQQIVTAKRASNTATAHTKQAGPPQPAHVRALVNPKIDTQKIARALLMWAKEQVRRERGDA